MSVPKSLLERAGLYVEKLIARWGDDCFKPADIRQAWLAGYLAGARKKESK